MSQKVQSLQCPRSTTSMTSRSAASVMSRSEASTVHNSLTMWPFVKDAMWPIWQPYLFRHNQIHYVKQNEIFEQCAHDTCYRLNHVYERISTTQDLNSKRISTTAMCQLNNSPNGTITTDSIIFSCAQCSCAPRTPAYIIYVLAYK